MIVPLTGMDAISMSFRHDAIAPAIRDRNPQVSSGDESLCGLEYRRATIAAALCRGNYQRGLASSWAAYFLLPDFLTALAVFATLWLRLAVVFFLLLRAVFFAAGRLDLLVAFRAVLAAGLRAAPPLTFSMRNSSSFLPFLHSLANPPGFHTRP